MTKKIIAIFRGTGYEIKEGKHQDIGFAEVEKAIDKSVKVYSYNGCQENGGGIFAYGVEEPCDDLYDNLLNLPASETIDLHVLAHSRGCISAYRLVEKINQNPSLKNRVSIFLDLRDPVPGNLGITASLDITHSNVAIQNRNLKSCTNVKEAHITIQEKGILDIGFNVLIPHFATSTKVAVEYLPGVHDIQQARNNYGESYCLGKEELDYLVCSDRLFALGLGKSLQLLQEQGVKLIINDLQGVIKLQVAQYDALLSEYKNNPKLYRQLISHKRDMHYGGHFVANKVDINEIDVLNTRHAALKNINHPKPLLTYLDSMVRFHRFDIKHGIMVDKALSCLDTLTNESLKGIFDKIKQEQGAKSSFSLLHRKNKCEFTIDPDKSALENLHSNLNANGKYINYAVARDVVDFNTHGETSLQKYLLKRLVSVLDQKITSMKALAESNLVSQFSSLSLSSNSANN